MHGSSHMSANKSFQRSVNHKLLGRGRVVSAYCWVRRARVLIGRRAAAKLRHYAALRHL
jgi:hypothetical protein